MRRHTRLNASRLGPAKPRVPHYPRPKVRADCVDGPRPCPFVGCRYNLSLDVSRAGSIRYRLGIDFDKPEAQANCALDFADEGPRTLRDVAPLMATTLGNVNFETQAAFAQLEALGLKDIADQWDD